jgi:hypothetical protein
MAIGRVVKWCMPNLVPVRAVTFSIPFHAPPPLAVRRLAPAAIGRRRTASAEMLAVRGRESETIFAPELRLQLCL